MKRKPPGWKARQQQKNPLPAPSISSSFLVGDAAQDSFRAMLNRMAANPENFIFLDDDDSLLGSGYMCTGCAMPAEGPGLSACCGLPVVDTDD